MQKNKQQFINYSRIHMQKDMPFKESNTVLTIHKLEIKITPLIDYID